MNIHIQQADDQAFLLGNRFLKSHKQGTAGKQDLLFVATPEGQSKVLAAVKLEKKYNHQRGDYYWLRNLFVSPEHRHQQIGSRLIKHLLHSLANESIYCFPHAHLTAFYQPLGWQLIAQNDLPYDLAEKYQSYHQSGKRFLIMHNQAR